MKKWSVVGLCLAAGLVGLTPARATETENFVLRILPAPGKVAIDGKTDDWDLSGGICSATRAWSPA